MRLGLRCASCGAGYSAQGDNEDLRRCVEDEFPCPRCGAPELQTTTQFSGDLEELTASQLWGALNGLGLPDEVVADAEPVRAMLLAHRVVDATVEQTPTGRVELQSLRLDNGITLHLAASGYGAVIFKMTRTEENQCQR